MENQNDQIYYEENQEELPKEDVMEEGFVDKEVIEEEDEEPTYFG